MARRNGRRTLMDAALSLGTESRVLCLKHESANPRLAGAVLLLTVEASPVAAGLLRG